MKTTKPEQDVQPDQRRRKLFRGVSGGVGVLMAVQAKTALGGTCASPSAILSGNTSPRPNTGVTCSGGRSPGFWKVPQKFYAWTGIATVPTFSAHVSPCASGMQNLTLAVIVTQGTLLSSIFPGAPSNVGIWAVLAFPNSFAGGQLLRHLCAAWLNSQYSWPGGKYPLSAAQVVDMWNATKSGGTYCPTGLTCASNKEWDSETVIKYISDMYDLNAETIDGPELCK